MGNILMPHLGESVTEGTVVRWLKQEGERVERYEPVVEVLTDKVNAEIPSDFSGVLTTILVQEKQTVPIGTVLGVIDTPSANKEGGIARDDTAANTSIVQKQTDTKKYTERVSASKFSDSRLSPAVLRLAQEHSVDLSIISGTGHSGRVTRKDVLTHIEARGAVEHPSMKVTEKPREAQSTNAFPMVAASDTVEPDAHRSEPNPRLPDWAQADPIIGKPMDAGPGPEEEWMELTPMRRTIAARMTQSMQEIPHAWTIVEADVTNLVKFRERVKDDFRRKEGVNLTYMAFFIKAVAQTLREFPILNSSWAGDKIIVHKHININMAVGTEQALTVPIIHDADRLSILGLAHKVHDIAARARGGQLTPADIKSGTFTVNNTGFFGSVMSAPIINGNQAAILSLESIVKRPVVLRDDAIAIRSMVNLCLSLDHRILDGIICGRFLSAVKERLEAYDDNTVL